MRAIYLGIGLLASAIALPSQAAILIKADQSARTNENLQYNDHLPNDVNPLVALTQRGTSVTLTSTGPLTFVSRGQARITGADDVISELTVQLTDPGLFLTAFEFTLNPPKKSENITAIITAWDQYGVETVFGPTELGTGNNWFSGIVTETSLISKFRIQTQTPITDVRQIRLTTVEGAVDAVPEPASWAMFILGFGLIGASLRRRRTHFVLS